MAQIDAIKELRDKTGASISEVKRAIDEAGGDAEKALRLLELALGAKASQKSGRATNEGVVDCYVHSDRKIGVLVEALCETDFVARTEEFRAFVHDVALHIAAMNPMYIRREDVPEETVEAERRLIAEEVSRLSKPKEVIEQIISGKLENHLNDILLLNQPFVKNQDKTVGEVLSEVAGKFGENVRISRFIRFAL